MKMIFLSLFMLLVAGPLFAKENLLLTISTDIEARVSKLFLISDNEGVAQKLILENITSGSISTYDISELKKGIVLEEQGGYKVAVLKSRDFAPDRGGYLYIDYLNNGLTGNRRTIDIEGRIIHDGFEVAYNGFTVNKAHIIGNQLFGKVVGIKEIRFSQN